MQQANNITVEWHIVFVESSYKNWIMNRLQPGFGHVYAMKKTEGGNFWFVVEPLRPYLRIDQVLVSEYPNPRSYAGPDSIIIPVRAKIDRTTTRGTLGIFTCVDVVKSLVGIRAGFVFTPYQLYNYLMRHKR